MAVIRPLSEALTGAGVDLPAGAPVLEVKDVALRFAGVKALAGVSFEVRQGELLAIIGPNGAGKTSLLNCLSGVYRPQTGQITFLGHKIIGAQPDEIARLGLARAFQNIALFNNLTVLDNLMLGRHVHIRYGLLSAFVYRGKAKREEVRHRRIVEDIVDFLEIEQYRKLPVGLLPFGIKKRVELGRALAMEPKLLVLDEPVSGMNAEEIEDIARFILDIREELGVSMIMVEHEMGVVMDLADRVLVLDFGHQIAFGVPSEIQRDARVIDAYLGEGPWSPEATASATGEPIGGER
ncbi:MAG: ABC transporter ATP-binding protein [Actinomycetota bacterium]